MCYLNAAGRAVDESAPADVETDMGPPRRGWNLEQVAGEDAVTDLRTFWPSRA